MRWVWKCGGKSCCFCPAPPAALPGFWLPSLVSSFLVSLPIHCLWLGHCHNCGRHRLASSNFWAPLMTSCLTTQLVQMPTSIGRGPARPHRYSLKHQDCLVGFLPSLCSSPAPHAGGSWPLSQQLPRLNCIWFYGVLRVHPTGVWFPVSQARSVSYLPLEAHNCPGGLAAQA